MVFGPVQASAHVLAQPLVPPDDFLGTTGYPRIKLIPGQPLNVQHEDGFRDCETVIPTLAHLPSRATLVDDHGQPARTAVV